MYYICNKDILLLHSTSNTIKGILLAEEKEMRNFK